MKDINCEPQGRAQSPERTINNNKNYIPEEMSIGMLENANENTQKNLIQEKNSTTKSVGLEKGVYREDATSEDRGKLDELNKK